MIAEQTVKRFWAKVNKIGADECWLWTASALRGGYGQFRVRGRGMHTAHRVSWELAHGPIHAGLFVLHTCDVPACVNPAHLWLGTHADNMRDKCAKGRQSRARGGLHGNAKISEADVRQIRARSRGGESRRSIAALFGISHRHVRNIVSRKRWAHVTDGPPPQLASANPRRQQGKRGES